MSDLNRFIERDRKPSNNRLKVSITNNRADNPKTCASCRFTYPARKPPRWRGRNSMPKIMKEFHVFAKLPSIGDIVPSLPFSLSSRPEYRFGQTWWSLRLGSSIICAINRKFFSLCIIAGTGRRVKRGKSVGVEREMVSLKQSRWYA